MAGFGEPPPDDLSLKDAWANILRGMTSKDQWQQVGQGAQNVKNVAPSVVESLARGSLAQIPGTLGDINDLIINHIGSAFPNAPKAPTTEQILQAVPRITPDYQGSRQHEMVGEVTGPALAKMLKMGAEATKGMPVGNMIAYHGTPHEIQGAFDISKVGTGEGAQAYGHGMYFAESPKVAESYANNIPAIGSYPSMRRSINGIEVQAGTPEAHAATLLSRDGMTVKKAKDLVNSWIQDPSAMSADVNVVNGWKKTLETLNGIKKKSDVKDLGMGNLYKVDIPDEYIPTMMDWDKPLGQQSPFVQKAVNSIKSRITPDMKAELGDNLNLLFGKDVTPNQFLNTLEIIHPESTVGIGEKWLDEAGVKGMRYLDNASRAKGKGTSNFVVFDPKEVKILEKNGQPTRKELIEEQINKLK